MRRQDPLRRPARTLREQVQTIGVDDGGLVAIQCGVEQRSCPVVLAQTRPHCENVCALQQRPQVVNPLRRRDRSVPDGRSRLLRRFRMGGDRNETCSRPQRRLAGHARSARHADASADDEHAPLRTLVCRATPARQRRGDRPFVKTPGSRLNECKLAGTYAKTIEKYIAGVIGSDAQIKPQLESDEGDRSVGDNRGAERVPGISV